MISHHKSLWKICEQGKADTASFLPLVKLSLTAWLASHPARSNFDAILQLCFVHTVDAVYHVAYFVSTLVRCLHSLHIAPFKGMEANRAHLVQHLLRAASWLVTSSDSTKPSLQRRMQKQKSSVNLRHLGKCLRTKNAKNGYDRT